MNVSFKASGFTHLLAGLLAVVGILTVTGPLQAEIIKRSMSLAPGQTASVTVPCRSGWMPTGGGALSTTPMVRVSASYPDTDNSWKVTATNLGSATETVWANAQCVASMQSYWRQARATSTPIASGSVGQTTAVCPGGRIAFGGGWHAPNHSMPIIASRIDGNGWRVRAFNGSSGGALVTSYVTCASSQQVRTVTPVITNVEAGSSVNPPLMACPTGWLASAGFAATADTNWTIVTGSLPVRDAHGDKWKWNFKNWDSVDHAYERTLVCFN